ncbi:MAG: VOC family protein [Acidobacteriota bacterium]
MSDHASEMATQEVPARGEFVWSEIASTDAEKCIQFYSNVFGWQFKRSNATQDGMDYREFSYCGEYPKGGLYQIDPKWFGGNPPPAHILNYIAVDDVDKAAKLAVELGAKVHKTMDIPNVGRMSIIEDPTGGMFATFMVKM